MGTETNSSPTGKRSRDPEDEVYVDNLHCHKRYLSQIMASSLNGLTVGDPIRENLLESPARSDNLFYLRDDLSLQYSPMSEDSDDSRYCDTPPHSCPSQPESAPTSPVSPHRYQRPLSGLSSTSSCTLAAVSSPQPRQRGSDSEGRFPSSPSDICHQGDLRRTALMRSVQMRTQPVGPSSFELSFCPENEAMHSVESEDQPCSYAKSAVDEREYQISEPASLDISDPEFNLDKSCRVLNLNMNTGMKGGEESGDRELG